MLRIAFFIHLSLKIMKNFLHKTILLPFVLSVMAGACSSPLQTPAGTRDFETPSNYEEVRAFCYRAAESADFLETEVFGQSEEGRDLILVKATKAGKTPGEEKLRVLLFAQQHGNEQASKEGVLLLIRDLANGKYGHWLDHMELWMVPQVNPDGGERNQRRNAAGLDLNRDHLLLEAKETRALHELFHELMPHMTIDVHEYQPYRQAWADFGGYKQFDVQVGVTTNINIDQDLRSFSLEKALPQLEHHLVSNGYSFHNYLVGPPPSEGITRHSTVDINDGRQSFGILNTLAFIFEGINGRDGFADQLEHRSKGQLEALFALLDFSHAQKEQILPMVEKARQRLIGGWGPEQLAIQTEYVRSGESLSLPLKSSATDRDTLVVVDNYYPLVKPVLSVSRPRGYLVPKRPEFTEWMDRHRIRFRDTLPPQAVVYAYDLRPTRRTPPSPPGLRPFDISAVYEHYWYVPLDQLHANMLVLALEPRSETGLARLPGFSELLTAEAYYPILRLE